jgi:hypothetical protein
MKSWDLAVKISENCAIQWRVVLVDSDSIYILKFHSDPLSSGATLYAHWISTYNSVEKWEEDAVIYEPESIIEKMENSKLLDITSPFSEVPLNDTPLNLEMELKRPNQSISWIVTTALHRAVVKFIARKRLGRRESAKWKKSKTERKKGRFQTVIKQVDNSDGKLTTCGWGSGLEDSGMSGVEVAYHGPSWGEDQLNYDGKHWKFRVKKESRLRWCWMFGQNNPQLEDNTWGRSGGWGDIPGSENDFWE